MKKLKCVDDILNILSYTFYVSIELFKSEPLKYHWVFMTCHWLKSWEVSHWELMKMYTDSFSESVITDWISEYDWTNQLYGLLIESVKLITLKIKIK